jgi:hypothetical protein
MSASVKVRMYRQGLGDCFLLRFTEGGSTKSVLIDCGVVIGSPNGEAKTNEVVEQLAKDCDKRLDVVVATHEHWDHVSGFGTAQALFKDIKIGEIWMAWTENPKDKLANSIRKDRGLRIKKLAAALTLWEEKSKLATTPDSSLAARRTQTIAGVHSLLDFFGPGDLGAKGDKTRAALNFLKEHKAPKKYLNPGDEEKVPGIDGVRVYVLGPPRDYAAIKKDLPSTSDPETYEENQRLSAAAAFLAGADAATAAAAAADPTAPDAAAAADEAYQPFDSFYRIKMSEAQTQSDPFFRDRYGFDAGKPTDSANGKPSWRRIDDDWLSVTSELALMLDSDTNNTSLVLAFELGDKGDVLLFAADAQVGNWLSWDDARFERENITAETLLKRTVFYKVGHHASHNATLRDKGLERMTSRKLSAFIPVVATTASKIGWKKMPFTPLLDRLRERCRNRIVRMDKGVDADASAAFEKSIERDDLFFEVEFSGD